MNKVIKMTGLLTMAGAAVGAALLLSAPAQAQSAKGVKCHNSSKLIVDNCCDRWEKPTRHVFWLFDSKTSCGKVACSSVTPKKFLASAMIIKPKKVKYVCGDEFTTNTSHGGNPTPPPPTRNPPSITYEPVPTLTPVGTPQIPR